MENLLLSVFTGLLWAGALGGILHLVRKKGRDKPGRSFPWGIMYVLFFLRILLPFDLRFGRLVPVSWLLNWGYRLLCLRKFSFFSLNFSLIQLLALLALAASVVKVGKFMKKYVRVSRILRISQPLTEIEQAVFDQVSERIPGGIQAVAGKSAGLNSPVFLGIVRKKICLPLDASFTEKELEHIFLHELYHFRNRDHLLHLTARLAQCIFWWFPLVKLLVRDLEEFMELRCDACAAGGMNLEEKEGYLRTITKILKRERNSRKEPQGALLAFAPSDKKLLQERFLNVVDCEPISKGKKLCRGLLAGFLLALYGFSYLFILAPAYEPNPKEITEGNPKAMEITPENGVLYYSENGEIYLITGENRFKVSEELAETFIYSGFPIEKE